MGVGVRAVRAARAVRNRGGEADSRENERETREYRDGTGRSNCREREFRVWGARCKQIILNIPSLVRYRGFPITKPLRQTNLHTVMILYSPTMLVSIGGGGKLIEDYGD
jgi:hypothetical protein